MNEDKAIMVYITASSKNEALKIARNLVDDKLLACANVIGNVTSIYRWDGNVNEDNECVIIGKTTEILFEPLVDTVKNLHSYDCPCIVSLNIENSPKDFLKWLANSVKLPY